MSLKKFDDLISCIQIFRNAYKCGKIVRIFLSSYCAGGRKLFSSLSGQATESRMNRIYLKISTFHEWNKKNTFVISSLSPFKCSLSSNFVLMFLLWEFVKKWFWALNDIDSFIFISLSPCLYKNICFSLVNNYIVYDFHLFTGSLLFTILSTVFVTKLNCVHHPKSAHWKTRRMRRVRCGGILQHFTSLFSNVLIELLLTVSKRKSLFSLFHILFCSIKINISKNVSNMI